MNTPDQALAPIKARLEAATPGPWSWRNTGEPMLLGARSRLVMAFSRMGMGSAQPEFRDRDGLIVKAGKANLNAFPDAVFIANAPTDITRLLAAVERALELHVKRHAPAEPWAQGYKFTGEHCGHDGQHWPCETVAALSEALGGGE
jgi:hypothetical protein